MKRGFDWRTANVLGTIHSKGGFAAAKKAASQIHGVEVRVDCLPVPPTVSDLKKIELPILLTVRGEEEGGALPLPPAIRSELYLELLEAASAVDIEGKQLRHFQEVISAAHKAKKQVVASFHDFDGVPSAKKFAQWADKARVDGADIIKIAATVKTPASLSALFALFEAVPGPLAVMGMGPLGRASRLACAQCGSVLNYGWLDKPQVPGQWPAAEFATLLRRSLEAR